MMAILTGENEIFIHEKRKIKAKMGKVAKMANGTASGR